MSAPVFAVERALALKFVNGPKAEELAQGIADLREWYRGTWQAEADLQSRRPQPESKKGKS